MKSEWSKVTVSDLILGKASSVLTRYGSLYLALLHLYPELEWKGDKIQDWKGQDLFRTTSQHQKEMWTILHPILSDLKFNYRHPLMRHSPSTHSNLGVVGGEEGDSPSRSLSGRNMELDFFSPSLSLAIEYQGGQHFEERFRFRSLESQERRDREKRESCRIHGITLVEIPYWWNEKEESLIATIKNARPDLFVDYRPKNPVDFVPIPPSKPIPSSPQSPKRPPLPFDRWTRSIDPTGWFVSEKSDGLVLWDGNEFYSSEFPKIRCPQQFKEKMPKEPLHGLLWIGKDSPQKEVVLSGESVRWNNVFFHALDAPDQFHLPYEQRFNHLRELINSQLKVRKGILRCRDENHLFDLMRENLRSGGEGLFLHRPDSISTSALPNSPHPLGKKNLLVVELYETDQAVVTPPPSSSSSDLLLRNCLEVSFSPTSVGEGIGRKDLKEGQIVSYRYLGIDEEWRPLLSRIDRILPKQVNGSEGLIPFRFGLGPSSGRPPVCRGCKKTFERNQLRVEVKGIHRHPNPEKKEAVTVVFSFCPKLECIEEGTEKDNRIGRSIRYTRNFRRIIQLTESIENLLVHLESASPLDPPVDINEIPDSSFRSEYRSILQDLRRNHVRFSVLRNRQTSLSEK
eukprot:TRINITY_DN2324_c1_g1_i1.p1 TRINITY_DN2324_c1_g1~~TRINITY_DN2324_c1_g1_i1.p1  ORF type:complete len:626 (-),score=120.03 TRINITY_DN2324_c1_g1_i1:24-1901(-)